MNAMYGWIVDIDHAYGRDETKDSAGGTMGPRDIPDDLSEALTVTYHGEGRRWRTAYDPDGPGQPIDQLLVHEGRMVYARPEDVGSEMDFAPLEDFSKPEIGADVIQWWNEEKREWETL